MYCSKCGKEIKDDSIFCYSCGSRVEIKEKQVPVSDTPQKEEQETTEDIPHEKKQEIIIDTPPPVVDQKIPPESKDSEQTTPDQKDEQVVSSDELQSSLKKKEWGWGWIVLVCFYMSYILKTSNTLTGTSLFINSVISLLF